MERRNENAIIANNGSIQPIDGISRHKIIQTAWEIKQRSIIDMAADRGAFIDQSQSLNLFMESLTIKTDFSSFLCRERIENRYVLFAFPSCCRPNQFTVDVEKQDNQQRSRKEVTAAYVNKMATIAPIYEGVAMRGRKYLHCRTGCQEKLLKKEPQNLA